MIVRFQQGEVKRHSRAQGYEQRMAATAPHHCGSRFASARRTQLGWQKSLLLATHLTCKWRFKTLGAVATLVDQGLQCLGRFFFFLFFLVLNQTMDDYRGPLLRPSHRATVSLCSNKRRGGLLAGLVWLAKWTWELSTSTGPKDSCISIPRGRSDAGQLLMQGCVAPDEHSPCCGVRLKTLKGTPRSKHNTILALGTQTRPLFTHSGEGQEGPLPPLGCNAAQPLQASLVKRQCGL